MRKGWEWWEESWEAGQLEEDQQPREKPQSVRPTERVENDASAHRRSWVTRGKESEHEEVVPTEIRKKEDDKPDFMTALTTTWRQQESLCWKRQLVLKTW